ncbi:MAG TPA: hypothetical protein DCZ95_18235 [Verrucomicrobia bacterium]|nr:hypothetical protein [Verrucomicrobiota bacterium]
MSLAQIKIDWDARPFTAEVRRGMEEIVQKTAAYVEEEAKKNLERSAPDSTGTLASEIDIMTSKYKDGGYLVTAQANRARDVSPETVSSYDELKWKSGDPYASFVELGTKNMQGLSYMRKALRRGKYKARALMKQMFGELRG